MLLRTRYANDDALQELPVVFTIHNMGYHGAFPRDTMKKIGLPESLFGIDAMEFYGRVNFLKGALIFSDFLTTVSPKYAEEIQTAEYGHGLDGVVRNRADRLTGILNGVDYASLEPGARQSHCRAVFAEGFVGQAGMQKKSAGSVWLAAGNREQAGDRHRLALCRAKGFRPDRAKLRPELLAEDLAIVALGAGEPKYEKLFRELAKAYPAKFSVKVAYDNILAHKIEAGADMFLMPSRYEPCGLNQIYSLKYGTVPVVRATGGLDDTIDAFDPATGRGTGFKFLAYDGRALLGAIQQALSIFRNEPAVWRRIQLNGMAKDFSWQASAMEYVKLYEVAWKSRNQKA